MRALNPVYFPLGAVTFRRFVVLEVAVLEVTVLEVNSLSRSRESNGSTDAHASGRCPSGGQGVTILSNQATSGKIEPVAVPRFTSSQTQEAFQVIGLTLFMLEVRFSQRSRLQVSPSRPLSLIHI